MESVRKGSNTPLEDEVIRQMTIEEIDDFLEEQAREKRNDGDKKTREIKIH